MPHENISKGSNNAEELNAKTPDLRQQIERLQRQTEIRQWYGFCLAVPLGELKHSV